MIAIWGGPENTIPGGWAEYVPLRGRMAVGMNPDDVDFNVVGVAGGAKTKILELTEIPAHDHKQGSEALYNKFGGGTLIGQRNFSPGLYNSFVDALTSKSGGLIDESTKAFSIMNPYRIVHYIKYIG